MKLVHRRAVPAVATSLLLLGSAACGSGGEATASGTVPGSAPATSSTTEAAQADVEKLLNDSITRAQKATSVALSGEVKDKGKPVTVVMEGKADGTNQDISVKAPGLSVQMRTVGGVTWVKTLDAATASQSGMPTAAVGKWIEIPASTAKEMGDFTIAAVLKEFTAPGSMNVLEKANTAVEDVTEQGRPAYKLSQRVGGDGTQVVIAADGTPDMLKVSTPTDGTVTFTRWNAAQVFTAPPAAEIFQG